MSDWRQRLGLAALALCAHRRSPEGLRPEACRRPPGAARLAGCADCQAEAARAVAAYFAGSAAEAAQAAALRGRLRQVAATLADAVMALGDGPPGGPATRAAIRLAEDCVAAATARAAAPSTTAEQLAKALRQVGAALELTARELAARGRPVGADVARQAAARAQAPIAVVIAEEAA